MTDDNKQPAEPPRQEQRDVDLSHRESFRKSWDQVETGPTALAEPTQAAPSGDLPVVSDSTGQPVVQAATPTEGNE